VRYFFGAAYSQQLERSNGYGPITESFESGVADEFTAYISPAEEGGGDDGSGSSSLNGGYRYGFNGKGNDNEVKGIGNQQDYGMRIYDPRLGRFLSVDPLDNHDWHREYQWHEINETIILGRE
jgi:RHS repeat-associated protein